MSTFARPGPASRWDLVVPVKPLSQAKTRLTTAAQESLSADTRSSLALAFALDTVAAALACPSVRRVLVVTDDAVVASTMRRLGAEVVDDPGGGLNEALRHGARSAQGGAPTAGVGALLGDLPALRAAELEDVLAGAGAHAVSAVADADDEGTTLLVARAPSDFAPAFGRQSLRHHVRAGAVVLAGVPAGLRRDVDTAAHLHQALALGVGEHTREVVTAWVAGRD